MIQSDLFQYHYHNPLEEDSNSQQRHNHHRHYHLHKLKKEDSRHHPHHYLHHKLKEEEEEMVLVWEEVQTTFLLALHSILQHLVTLEIIQTPMKTWRQTIQRLF